MTAATSTYSEWKACLGTQLKQGKPGALAELYTDCGPRMFRAAWRILRSEADAEDVVQWAFVKAWEARASIREPRNVRAWLVRIVVNRAYTVVTRRRPTSARTDTPLADDLEQMFHHAERRAQLHRAIADLSPRQHDVVCLRVREELSFKEIGSRLGCSDVSARVNYRYGVQRLKERFAA